MSDQRLVAEYAEWAGKHGAGMLAFDSEATNSAQAELVKRYRAIRNSGDLRSLLPLLDHIDPSVSAWAATHLLEIEPDRAVRTLRRHARGSGPLALDAKMVLEQWEDGTLEIER
jgi:hypothetical protein